MNEENKILNYLMVVFIVILMICTALPGSIMVSNPDFWLLSLIILVMPRKLIEALLKIKKTPINWERTLLTGGLVLTSILNEVITLNKNYIVTLTTLLLGVWLIIANLSSSRQNQ